MSKTDLVSIVVPVYNVENYIDQCLESLIGQTYQQLEILLIDDGSTDGSLAKCQNWVNRDNRVRCIHRENGGLAAARNTGLDNSSGSYICFVDSDDWIEPTMIECMVGNLVQTDSDISIIGSRYAYENGSFETNYIPNVKMTLSKGQAFKYINMPGYFGVGVWDKLYKKELFEGLRFPEQVRRSEDCRLTYHLLKEAERICYTSDCLYNYRQRSASLSNNNPYISREPADAALDMLRYVEDHYPEMATYARYGYMRAATGVYNALLQSHSFRCPAEWGSFEKEIRHFLNESYPELLRSTEVTMSRKVQFGLLRVSPGIYGLVLKCFKCLCPKRIE